MLHNNVPTLFGHGRVLCRCGAVLVQCRCMWNPATHTERVSQTHRCAACEKAAQEHVHTTVVESGKGTAQPLAAVYPYDMFDLRWRYDGSS